MIDLKTLKHLVKLMKDNELTELDIRDQDEQVLLKRQGAQGPVQQMMPVAAAPAPVAAPAAAPAAAAPAADAGAAEDDGLVAIESPMVGTFYSSPTPDADVFVKVGATVDTSTVVCIVEAMKVFNEIKAEVSGKIEKVLVANGESIEYGQKLFLVRPS